MTDTPKPEFISDFLKFTNHGRLHMSRYGSSSRTDNRIFIGGLDGELAMVLAFDTPEEAELELIAISEQVDKWEAANAARLSPAPNRPNRR